MAREVYPTESFKQKSKQFILVKINGDQQPSVVAQYGVQGFPNIKFMKADGSVVHEIGGYVPLQRFLAEMDTALGSANR